MIRRYSRAMMRDIWEEQNKLSIWLKIEILARPLVEVVPCIRQNDSAA